MYAPSFGLKHDPFSIAPDPRYLFMSDRHREALAHLLYGLDGGGGFVLLTGEIGTGKTTVCRCFLEQIPAHCNVAYIFNPKLTVGELLQSVCDEFGIAHTARAPGFETVKDCIDPLNAFLLQAHADGRNNVLIIDEAQNLSADVLEQLRLLTNLETSERKLLQIVLIGQPELRRMLAAPELEQLAQRVIARFHLDALSAEESTAYIAHRMAVAGWSGPLPFDRAALQRIHRLTGGVPRRINLLCGRALLGAYASARRTVDRAIVDRAAGEVFGSAAHSATAAGTGPSLRGVAGVMGAVVAALVLVGVGAWIAESRMLPTTTAAGSAPTAPPTAAASANTAAAGAASAAASAPLVQASARAGALPIAAIAAPASASASAAVAAPVPSQLPEPAALHRDDAAAWRALGQRWGVDAGDRREPCSALARQSLQCFSSRSANLALVRQFDRPGIVTLYDADGTPGYALLIGLDAGYATLVVGDARWRVPLAALAERWRGEFATLWRAPPGYASRPGERLGPATGWLVEQLATLQRQPPPSSEAATATWLRRALNQFQVAHGLTPDGLAGPVTFMQLNRTMGVDEPHLDARP